VTKFTFCDECGKWTIIKDRRDGRGVDILVISVRNGRKRKERINSPVILSKIPENFCIACGTEEVKLLPNHEIPNILKGTVWKKKGGSY